MLSKGATTDPCRQRLIFNRHWALKTQFMLTRPVRLQPKGFYPNTSIQAVPVDTSGHVCITRKKIKPEKVMIQSQLQPSQTPVPGLRSLPVPISQFPKLSANETSHQRPHSAIMNKGLCKGTKPNINVVWCPVQLNEHLSQLGIPQHNREFIFIARLWKPTESSPGIVPCGSKAKYNQCLLPSTWATSLLLFYLRV